MMTEREVEHLRANPRFLVRELMRRGIDVEVFDWDNEVIEARLGEHVELFLDIDSSRMPFSASSIASSKSLTKRLLARAGISTPKGSRFSIADSEAAVGYCCELGFPVVIKPSLGVQGELVHMDIESAYEARLALQSIAEAKGEVEVIVEEQFAGEEYRVFVTQHGEFAVVHRDPASVLGDGVHTIKELAEAESHRRMNPRVNCLCPVVLDEEAERFIKKRGKRFDSIPARGEKIYLRRSSNIKLGGFCTDYTELVHPSVIEICYRALRAIPALPYGGLDFMSTDITKEQTPEMYRILEINSLPGIGIHCAPGAGQSRNVPGMIVDLVFPESIPAGGRLDPGFAH